MTSKNDLMFKLNHNFVKNIFMLLNKKLGGSFKAGKILHIPPSSFRSYKNGYAFSLPKNLIDKILDLSIITQKEIEENTLSTYLRNEQNKIILDKGREIRLNKLKSWKEEIPSFNEILKDNYLDFEQWFLHYRKLIDFGARTINYIKEKDNFLEVNYTNYVNKTKKEFTVNLPTKIKLDEELIYFFGLWCGDRAGGKRFGITNKNKEIIEFTEYFLKKNHQNVEKTLYISKKADIPSIFYDKIFIINHDVNGWVLSVHSTNGILASFFHYLDKCLDEFLEVCSNKYAFFAGLFDAEGNVSLYNKSLRFACKDARKIEIYAKYLKKLQLYKRYDGGCLITYNKNEFYDKILPYIKHPDKINLINLLCKKEGVLPKDYLEVLNFITKYPKKTAKEITKGLKKTKVDSQLRLLQEMGYITRESYPYQYTIKKVLDTYGGKKL